MKAYDADQWIEKETQNLQQTIIKKADPHSVRVQEANYQKAFYQALRSEVDPYQLIKTLLYSGKFVEAKLLLEACKIEKEGSLSDFERKTDQYRILYFEGKLQDALSLALDLFTFKNIPDSTYSAILQLVCMIHLELRNRYEYLKTYEVLLASFQVCRNPQLEMYTALMHAKYHYTFEPESFLEKSNQTLQLILMQNENPNLDFALTIARHYTLRARHQVSSLKEAKTYLAQISLAKTMGDSLYECLAVSELNHRFSLPLSQDYRKKFELYSTRISQNLKNLTPLSHSNNLSQYNLSEPSYRHIYFSDIKLLFDLEEKKCFQVKSGDQVDLFLQAYQEKSVITKDEMMNAVWSISHYHSIKHANNVRVLLNKMRKFLGPCLLHKEHEIQVESLLVL